MLSPVFSHPLTRLFNLSIVKGTFPSKWKVARITPLYKDGARDSRDNNRPISLLSVLSKVMEKHVATSFVNYLAHSELLYDLQSAFCEGHSTESALIKLTNKILFSLGRDEVTGMIFVDFGKAFYVVNHQPLLSKLGSTKQVTHTFLVYIISFREKTVRDRSDPLTIKQGVPQGSV